MLVSVLHMNTRFVRGNENALVRMKNSKTIVKADSKEDLATETSLGNPIHS